MTMDKGAHFRRCDFQVHTPRDPQWAGRRCHSEEDRKAYAETLIQQCRDKRLDAIAITDHHDFAFFPYIREAARSERDDDGSLVPEAKQIVVFPGVELTLGVPCQALLLLDADFDSTLLPQLYGILAIKATPPEDPQLPSQVTRLTHIDSFVQLYRDLNRHEFLRGRFIVLPNVSDGGRFTLLRSGNYGKYIEMPCVGGYVDRSIDDLGRGNRDILAGRDRQYGYKSIGVFQTSDNRREDGRELGRHTTWVKWATPTAEALRQACLARSTRILHAPPQLPSLVVESLHVSLSKFMGAIDLYFNPQFNCIIGGRGTGKSTLLEYLRWALCDEPSTVSDAVDVPDFGAKREDLINNTLAPHNATVTVRFTINGVRHEVRRKTETGEVLLKVGDENFNAVHESHVRELLPIQAYSQKQLSAVGVRADELLRFVESPVARQLGELQSRRSDYATRIRHSFVQLQSKRRAERKIAQQEVEVKSLQKQLVKLQEGLKGLSEDDQAVLQKHEKYLTEQTVLDGWDRNRETALQAIRDARSVLDTLPTAFGGQEDLPNNGLLMNAYKLFDDMIAHIRRQLEDGERVFSDASERWQEYSRLRREWLAEYEAHRKRYEDVKKRAVEHETLLKQIGDVEARIKNLKDAIAKLKEDCRGFGLPDTEYHNARDEWISLFRKEAELLENRCRELTKLSDGMIRATLKRGAGVNAVQEKLQAVLEGTGIRSQAKKLDDLCKNIMESDCCAEEWQKILGELESLADVDFGAASTPSMPSTPALNAVGFSTSDIEKVARKLNPDTWLELALTELDDVPVFEYRLREDEYVPFANASAGQQATALLHVLLNQQGPPLVIDQPEDDLDNPVILEVVERIWAAKRNRQIIFSSHNANIVVNGDADLVVCCAHRTTGDQSGGKIKCEGAIDVPMVREEITTVMEGGKEAFQMRQDKYGF